MRPSEMRPRMMHVMAGVFASVMCVAGAMAQDATGAAAGDRADKVIVPGFAATQPSRAHENYEPIVGTWNTVWTLMDQEGNVTRTIKGRATNEWIVGGRWVQSTFTTDLDMAGEKFHGVGLFGHDNTTGDYHNVWFESNRTAMQYDKGSYDAGTRTFTFEGEQPGRDGTPFTARTTMRIDSADQHTVELYVVRSKDDVTKVLEMVLRRVKDAEDEKGDEASPGAR
jgi:Protein of unknown function (DUF1579)